MTQHRTKEVCSVDNTMSLDLELPLKKPSAMSIVPRSTCINCTHVVVGMNFNKRRHVSKNKKKKTLTLRWKVKCDFIKQDDFILEGGKQHSASSFLFFTNKYLSFFVSKMIVEESFVEKLERQSKEKL
jgi:hypothetical protein